ncbi:hypothetical protein GUJ93_ZPchr0010g8474 [Zizania palustris]|uniref:Probable histidine kinase 2 n=1 Tax=Zizania palustris TaxID=103762 RepID=A0A8J6BDG9_ZIZPA|nr:hypothetical protein GUJ93_ZPchr0010g8474 [Zizania palustris]
MKKLAEGVSRWRRRCSFYLILFPLVGIGSCMVITVVAFSLTATYMAQVMGEATTGIMDSAFLQLAGSMQPVLQANRSAFTIAASLQDNVSSISHVRSKLFLAFSMQPLLAQVSYAGVDGAAFSYYRTDDGEARAMFTRSNHQWYTQAADPENGRLVGIAAAAPAAAHLPNATTQLLVDGNGSSGASLGEGWARAGVQMLFLSAPVSGGAGVVSAAVAVDDVVVRSAVALKMLNGGLVGMYYAIVDKGSTAPAAYKSLLDEDQIAADAASSAHGIGLFSTVTCTSSAIDALPKIVVHDGKPDIYRVACNNFDISGIHMVFRLVFRKSSMVGMFRKGGITMMVFVFTMVAAAAAACFVMARALRRAAAREAVLDAEIVRQKDALRQAERKSMNKSNAFASASHDIRSALAAIAGLIEVSRPEAASNPNVIDNLHQMDVCTKKLFDILNSILDTSKVESGKIQLEEVEFNMLDVLEESVDMVNVVGVNKGIEVVWDPCDFSVLKCGDVVGDCMRFKQILDNLLGNAMKFTHEGHVILRAWANRPIVRSAIGAPSRFSYRSLENSFFRFLFGAKEEGATQNFFNPLRNDPNSVEFYFEVDDSGIGIPKEKRESVFENYIQVKEGHGGTGLGLGIVQSFVRLMGGEISIKEKEPGERGTCFGFNVHMKTSEKQLEAEDIEERPIAMSESDVRASVFKEPNCFKGWHCVLSVHGDGTRRTLQAWMESIGMKVWMVPEVQFIASTLEKVQSSSAFPSRSTSCSRADCDVADGCFSSKEMVSQVLPNALIRNSNIMARNLGENHHPLALIIIVDVSNGRCDDVRGQATNFARIKNRVPCKVVVLADLKTSSEDLRRFEEVSSGCDLVLRKPLHASRLYVLLVALRDLQASPMHQYSSLAGHENSIAVQQDVRVIHPEDLVGSSTAASAEAERLDHRPTEEDDMPLDGMRVLLVEDTLVLQIIERKILNQLGATVELAVDGSKATDMFREALTKANVSEEKNSVPLPYDVIFMDCQMPQMDGYEATRRIRKEESSYGIHTPIIALTAHSMEEDRQEAIRAGMDLHLTKPLERRRIAEAVLGVCKSKDKN